MCQNCESAFYPPSLKKVYYSRQKKKSLFLQAKHEKKNSFSKSQFHVDQKSRKYAYKGLFFFKAQSLVLPLNFYKLLLLLHYLENLFKINAGFSPVSCY